MGKRKGISKKLRFEVFKRDSFTCQYCGKSAPSVTLHCDHIVPVAEDGANDLLNLVTSCIECNLGKGARTLSDTTIVAKQMTQAKLLNERRQQIEMIAKWKTEIALMENEALTKLEHHLEAVYSILLSEEGRADMKSAIDRFGIESVINATKKSALSYLKDETTESKERFLYYIPRICYWDQKRLEDPTVTAAAHVCAVAQKSWWRCNRGETFRIATKMLKDGWTEAELVETARASSGIMQFEKHLGIGG